MIPKSSSSSTADYNIGVERITIVNSVIISSTNSSSSSNKKKKNTSGESDNNNNNNNNKNIYKDFCSNCSWLSAVVSRVGQDITNTTSKSWSSSSSSSSMDDSIFICEMCTRISPPAPPATEQKRKENQTLENQKEYTTTSYNSNWKSFSKICSRVPIPLSVLVTQRWHIFLLVCLLGVPYRLVDGAGSSEIPLGLQGSVQKCDSDSEGDVWILPGMLLDPCYTCLCKGGEVQCERQICPSLQGCFLIEYGKTRGCCGVCKDCEYGNHTYTSGKELNENCIKTTCNAGVLTRSEIQCYIPCTHPVPPNNAGCCPSCSSCSVNGREIRHGEEAILNSDPCVRCKCYKGSLSCTKSACPVLACPPSATYLERGDCCPKCNGTRTRYSDSRICLLGDKVFPNGTTFRLDTCTNCTCKKGTALCDRVSCPPLECDPIHQVMNSGSCCPKCAEPEDVPRMQCVWKDTIQKNGDRWDVDNCQSCLCDWGKVRCTEQMCAKNTVCSWGYQLKYKPGQCCPECVGEEGVCTVFGDPHYRSFDGRVFNFQGACKYLLTSDCKGKSFSVRVKNDARESTSFSWTRTVTLKVKEGKVTLGQKMRIKVNGKRVALPFNRGALNIFQEGYSAIVDTGVGVKLLWDGDSFLEVSVPHTLQGRTCGLCGNFNGNKSDDFVTRRGGPVIHPSTFGQSWRVGGKKACSRPEEVKGPEPLCKKGWRIREKAERLCNAIRSHVFAPCAKIVSPDRFFKSCKLDMCECPVGRKCHCEVLTAYARACQRAGNEILDWREATGCSHKKLWPLM